MVKKNKKDEEYNRLKKEKQELFRQLGEANYEKEFLKKIQAAVRERSRLIDRTEQKLSIRKQCRLFGINSSMVYYKHRNRRRCYRGNIVRRYRTFIWIDHSMGIGR